MNLDECIRCAEEIDRRFLEPICPRNCKRSEKGTEIWHLRWMISQINVGMSENKAMRWLGYIQGIMVGVYDVPLAEMKELNRKMVYGQE